MSILFQQAISGNFFQIKPKNSWGLGGGYRAKLGVLGGYFKVLLKWGGITILAGGHTGLTQTQHLNFYKHKNRHTLGHSE